MSRYCHAPATADDEKLGCEVKLPSKLLSRFAMVVKLTAMVLEIVAAGSKAVGVNLDAIADKTSKLARWNESFLRSNGIQPNDDDSVKLMNTANTALPEEPLDGSALKELLGLLREANSKVLRDIDKCFYILGLYKTPIGKDLPAGDDRRFTTSSCLWLCQYHRSVVQEYETGKMDLAAFRRKAAAAKKPEKPKNTGEECCTIM